MIKSGVINKSELFYTTKYVDGNLNEYYQHILNNIRLFLTNNNVPYSVNFGCEDISKDINLDFQFEHTILKNGEDRCTCKIHRFYSLIKNHSVFEYSNANIEHIKTFTKSDQYLNICHYYPPLIYEVTDSDNRTKNCLTIHNSNERRNLIHDVINMDYYHNVCPGNVYSKTHIKNVMDGYKLLVNIHQKETNLTLEELRVLPALMTGILIISEDVPYKEHIPYSKHIIWSSYDKLITTINNVLNNYDFFRKQYLSGLDETLNEMRHNSNKVMETIFKNYIK